MKSAYRHFMLASMIGLSLHSVQRMAAAAEFYKWVDAEGNTVYSKTPPSKDIKAEVVKAQAKADTEAATKAMQDDIKRVDDMRSARQKAAGDAQKAREEVAMQEENCQRARTRLASYSVPNARIIHEDGSQLRPDEETRQKMIKQAQEWVAQWCK